MRKFDNFFNRPRGGRHLSLWRGICRNDRYSSFYRLAFDWEVIFWTRASAKKQQKHFMQSKVCTAIVNINKPGIKTYIYANLPHMYAFGYAFTMRIEVTNSPFFFLLARHLSGSNVAERSLLDIHIHRLETYEYNGNFISKCCKRQILHLVGLPKCWRGSRKMILFSIAYHTFVRVPGWICKKEWSQIWNIFSKYVENDLTFNATLVSCS